MQTVSQKTGNEEAGRGREKHNRDHIAVPGIVNVEQIRYIRIYKHSARLANIYRLDVCFGPAILRYRADMARHPDSSIRHEIWLYLVHKGYRCFAILPDRVPQIPPLGNLPVRLFVEAAL